MSFDELKKTDASSLPIGKLISIIAKSQTIFLNHNLKDFGISPTQLHVLFEIYNQADINQEKIANGCNINKGVVARNIKKLEDGGFVKREIDENNRRQNKVSLTSKGSETLNKSISILYQWEDEVFSGNEMKQKEQLQIALKDLAIKSIQLNQRGEKQ